MTYYASDVYDLRDLAKELATLSESWSRLRRIQSPEEIESCDEDRLAALRELDSEFSDGMAVYADGISPTLIEDGYFEDYAREFAADIGAISGAASVSGADWPANHIDWEAAANQLKEDYTSVTFEGREYWIRG